MTADRSEGWDAVGAQFIAARSGVGGQLIRSWARDNLPRSAAVVDVGCGSGMPISEALMDEGLAVFGIDASPTLIAAFKRRFPDTPAACKAAQDSPFFHRQFDAAVAVGLLFLLAEDTQHQIIDRVANALRSGGRFLFSAPREVCEWQDTLTGRPSRSLGVEQYGRLLHASGMDLVGGHVDEGRNHYYEAVRRGP